MGVLWLLALFLFAGALYVMRSVVGRQPPRLMDRPASDDAWTVGAPANAYDNPYATSSDNEMAASGYCQGNAQGDGAIGEQAGNDDSDGDSDNSDDSSDGSDGND